MGVWGWGCEGVYGCGGVWGQGGGGSRKSDIMLKTPPRANFKKGGVWGGFKGVFRCAGVLSAERAPRPPPPPNEEHSVGHLRTVGYAAQV